MSTDRFLIAPFDANSGLQNNIKPFLIPDEAFAQLNNAYCWRGRIRKRFGSRWFNNSSLLTRLRVMVTTTSGGGSASGTVPGSQFNVGQMFSVDNNLFTVQLTGVAQPMEATGAFSSGTFSTTNGAFTIAGASPGSDVFWYPSLPVMGLASFENAQINNEPLIAFDTQFSYTYNTGWDQITGETNAGDSVWTGDDSQFFWFTTYTGVVASDYFLFVTNFNELEPNYMRYLSGVTWTTFRPRLSATGPIYLNSARILIPFKNRLLAFNTWEGADIASQKQYANRLRYCGEAISPIDDTGTSFFPWNQDVPGPGGGVDCPSKESIVTVEFIKDRLIVFLEKSTWEIVYTGNQISPFAWQQINTELGVESTFSVVPFDKVALGIGNLGIIGCTGANVDRIDEKIPETVFEFHSLDAGVERVYGIRDYSIEMTYWTIPTEEATSDFPYPNRVLVYNYKNGTWSFNDDSITAFGYYQPQAVDATYWSSTIIEWSSDTQWSNASLKALFKNVVAGNQQGWIFIVDSEEPINSPALYITNITVNANNNILINCINHNLRDGDYVYFQDIQASKNLGLLNGTIFAVVVAIPEDPNNFYIDYFDSSDTVIDPSSIYFGGGTIARVSQIQLLTKQYNFYMDKGRNAYVSKADFLIDRTTNGQIQVDYFVSTSDISMTEDSSSKGTDCIVGTGVLETFPYTTIPFESTASQLWHPVYFQADGEFIQLNIQLNDTQMRDPNIRLAGFQLHKMLFHAMSTSSRLQ